MLFLSTLSLRRATKSIKVTTISVRDFLSTLSLRRATLIISVVSNLVKIFYPRSPCGERLSFRRNNNARSIFLSTLSLRRATPRIFLDLTFHKIFYPRSPCGERRYVPVSELRVTSFSIHALLAESDGKSNRAISGVRHFSIHALLAESDGTVCQLQCRTGFSIHALLAESDAAWNRFTQRRDFFSIHALLAESDSSRFGRIQVVHFFYPRSPCGERPVNFHAKARKSLFYPRSPCGERQRKKCNIAV